MVSYCDYDGCDNDRPRMGGTRRQIMNIRKTLGLDFGCYLEGSNTHCGSELREREKRKEKGEELRESVLQPLVFAGVSTIMVDN